MKTICLGKARRLLSVPPPCTLPYMQLEEEDIREFTEIWALEFHETLSPGEAQLRASVLLELYALLATPHVPKGGSSAEDHLP